MPFEVSGVFIAREFFMAPRDFYVVVKPGIGQFIGVAYANSNKQ